MIIVLKNINNIDIMILFYWKNKKFIFENIISLSSELYNKQIYSSFLNINMSIFIIISLQFT